MSSAMYHAEGCHHGSYPHDGPCIPPVATTPQHPPSPWLADILQAAYQGNQAAVQTAVNHLTEPQRTDMARAFRMALAASINTSNQRHTPTHATVIPQPLPGPPHATT